jgi:hypothetical protein
MHHPAMPEMCNVGTIRLPMLPPPSPAVTPSSRKASAPADSRHPACLGDLQVAALRACNLLFPHAGALGTVAAIRGGRVGRGTAGAGARGTGRLVLRRQHDIAFQNSMR